VTEALAERPKGNLPAGVTSFVGRRGDVDEVLRLMSSARLVTLTGTGGVGKTRLAMRVAETRRRAFAGGVWWVPLADLADPDLVAVTILQVLEQQAAGTLADLARYLAGRQLLLVLDNCEHLVDACAEVVEAVLPAAPQVRLLATSRQPLDAMGEHSFGVAPLSLPFGEWAVDPGEYEAVTLFAERAAAATPGFELTDANRRAVVSLCRKLDGLPLAIELAASRTRALEVDQILQRWDDHDWLVSAARRRRQPRHQTLRAAMDWSFRLCDEAEQALLARLSVFTGSFVLRAAEAVCRGSDAAGLRAIDVLPALVGLVDKSLVVHESATGRYRLLETIRRYGQEHLAERGEQMELSRRHREYYLRLAEEYAAGWFGADQERLFTQIEGERTNLRAALTFCLSVPGEEHVGTRMARLLWTYWWFRPWTESRYWLERVLAADREDSTDRSIVMAVAGVMSVVLGDVDQGLAMVDRARQHAQRTADLDGLAHTTHLCGQAWVVCGRDGPGIALVQLGLDLELALPQPNPYVSLARHTLGVAYLQGGRIDEGVATLEALHAELEAAGEHLVRSIALTMLAVAELGRGQTARAAQWSREVLRLPHDAHGLRELARAMEFLAWIAADEDDHVRAARLFGIVQELWRRLGQDRTAFLYVEPRTQRQRRVRQALGDEGFEAEMRRGFRLGINEAITYALGTPAPPGTPAQTGSAPPVLTQRERQVAGLVAEGLSNKQIANRLVISQRTAENHVEHVLAKLGFTSRAQIATWVAAHRPWQDA
jgi:predicted ATPase/DNA-binding CsgD family transcriptional regulator